MFQKTPAFPLFLVIVFSVLDSTFVYANEVDFEKVFLSKECQDGDEHCISKDEQKRKQKQDVLDTVDMVAREPVTSKAEVPQGKFMTLSKKCFLKEQPDTNSTSYGRARPSGLRLWTEPSITGWVKVFRRKGEAFLPQDCF